MNNCTVIDGGISAPPSTASAAFVAPTAQTDAVSTSIGFAETGAFFLYLKVKLNFGIDDISIFKS